MHQKLNKTTTNVTEYQKELGEFVDSFFRNTTGHAYLLDNLHHIRLLQFPVCSFKWIHHDEHSTLEQLLRSGGCWS